MKISVCFLIIFISLTNFTWGRNPLISRVKFTSDSKYILAKVGSDRNQIKLWDFNGNLIQTYASNEPKGNFVMGFNVSPDAKYFAAILGGYRKIKLWDIHGKLLKTFKDCPLIPVVFSKNSEFMVFYQDHFINILNLKTLMVKKINNKNIRVLEFFPDDEHLTEFDYVSKKIQIRDINGNITKSFNFALACNPVFNYYFNHKKKKILVINNGTEIKCCDPNGKLLTEFGSHTIENKSREAHVKFSPDGNFFTLLTLEEVSLWSMNGNRIKLFSKQTSKGSKNFIWIPNAVEFSLDNKYLAISSVEGFQFFNMTGELIKTIEKNSSVYTIAFSPDNKYFAAGCWNGYISIWNIKGELIRSFEGW